jgi:hypothetical protein
MGDMSPRPRFRRVPYPVQLTDRDLELVRQVHRHRFLTSQHLKRLVKGSRQGIERRLQGLFHAGYLDRPRSQLDHYHRGGSRPLVYGLGSKGADLLTERDGLPPRFVNWTAKNRSITRFFLQHTLSVADFMTALEVAVHESDNVRHASAEELAASLGRGSRADLRWSVSLNHEGKALNLGVVPDQVFTLAQDSAAPVHYFLEADRATMPVSRHDFTRTSVQRKLLAYHATWQQRLLEQLFGWKRFRVLFLTTSAERVEHLRRAARELPSGHGLFLFAHRGQLKSDTDVLDLSWLPVSDEAPVTLRGG